MKTLKKVLSLVLALAMVLGMVVTASAATPKYTDETAITYEEAVKVMSLAGVLGGYPDGSFKPAGTLTRAEAAKMIVYMLGLEETSLGYKANFGDINGHWAETPISVAAGLGIVAGMGNGQFVPNGTLTGFQWAKILLCAMGYDAEIEGMLGAGWEAKVAKLAKATGMVSGITGFDGSKPVAREVAAKMAFNVVDYLFVGYPETGALAVTLGTKYYTGKSTVFGKKDSFADRLGIKVALSDDMFKRPIKKYTVDKDSVSILVDPEVAYTEATAKEDIYDDLALTEALKFTTYVNGAKEADTTVEDKTTKLGAQGEFIGFYDIDKNDDGEVDEHRLVVIDTYLAKVEKVTELKLKDNGKVKTQASIKFATKTTLGSGLTVTLKADEDYDYAKGDYVLVNVKDADEAIILGVADSKAQKLNAYVDILAETPAVKLDGEEEKLAEMFYIDYLNLENGTFASLAKTVLTKLYLGTTVTAYYDQYGNVIGVFAGTTDQDYYAVDCIWMSNKDGGKRADLKADIVDFEGNKTEAASISLDRVEKTFDLATELAGLVANYVGEYMRLPEQVLLITELLGDVITELGQLPTVSTTAVSGGMLGLVSFSENSDGEKVFEFSEDFIEVLADWLVEGPGMSMLQFMQKEVKKEDRTAFIRTTVLPSIVECWYNANCPWIFGDVKLADVDVSAILKFSEESAVGINKPTLPTIRSLGVVSFEAGEDDVYGLDNSGLGLTVTDETVFLFRDKAFSAKQDGEYTVYTKDTCPSFNAKASDVWYVEEDYELKVVYVADSDAYTTAGMVAFELNEKILKAITEDGAVVLNVIGDDKFDGEGGVDKFEMTVTEIVESALNVFSRAKLGEMRGVIARCVYNEADDTYRIVSIGAPIVDVDGDEDGYITIQGLTYYDGEVTGKVNNNKISIGGSKTKAAAIGTLNNIKTYVVNYSKTERYAWTITDITDDEEKLDAYIRLIVSDDASAQAIYDEDGHLQALFIIPDYEWLDTDIKITASTHEFDGVMTDGDGEVTGYVKELTACVDDEVELEVIVYDEEDYENLAYQWCYWDSIKGEWVEITGETEKTYKVSTKETYSETYFCCFVEADGEYAKAYSQEYYGDELYVGITVVECENDSLSFESAGKSMSDHRWYVKTGTVTIAEKCEHETIYIGTGRSYEEAMDAAFKAKLADTKGESGYTDSEFTVEANEVVVVLVVAQDGDYDYYVFCGTNVEVEITVADIPMNTGYTFNFYAQEADKGNPMKAVTKFHPGDHVWVTVTKSGGFANDTWFLLGMPTFYESISFEPLNSTAEGGTLNFNFYMPVYDLTVGVEAD